MAARFGWILSGASRGPDTVCDVDLVPRAKGAVVPSLGSLVPGWTLVVPRREALSFAHLYVQERAELQELTSTVAEFVAPLGSNVFIFEHGPSGKGGIIGCGVDQAHLHVVPMNFDLIELASRDARVDWRIADFRDPWSSLSKTDEYYLIKDRERCLVGTPRVAQRQYFRRLIATAVNKPCAWDYREWPFYEHAERTIEHYRGADLAGSSVSTISSPSGFGWAA